MAIKVVQGLEEDADSDVYLVATNGDDSLLVDWEDVRFNALDVLDGLKLSESCCLDDGTDRLTTLQNIIKAMEEREEEEEEEERFDNEDDDE